MITTFAPATAANLGPGFDVLGCALSGIGDWVTAERQDAPGVVIARIEGDGGRLPSDAARNTAAVAASATLRLAGAERQGVALTIRKGLPLGSGLGSSGASAAAAAWAVNLLLGEPLTKQELVVAGLEAEASASGWHADNVAPALLGGIVLIRSYEPLDLIELPVPDRMTLVLVTPAMELPTRAARAALPDAVPLRQHIANSGNLAAMVAALHGNSLALLGAAMQDAIVEPARAPLIPGFAAVKAAALAAGALACSISGAGPTLFALCEGDAVAPAIAEAMQRAFRDHAALSSRTHVAAVDREGARMGT